MREYVYKIKHKFIKKSYLLEKYGFYLFTDENGEAIIAKKITLPFECEIVKNTRLLFEYLYKVASDEEKQEDFKDFKFDKNGKVIITPELEKEWTECQLCFYLNGTGKNQLFINASDLGQYFNKIVLDECIKHDVDILLKNDIIYKAVVE